MRFPVFWVISELSAPPEDRLRSRSDLRERKTRSQLQYEFKITTTGQRNFDYMICIVWQTELIQNFAELRFDRPERLR